jgi:acetyl-CoA acetyltransferase
VSRRDVVIVEAVRTPIGRGHPEKGYYKDLHAADLLGRTFTELLARSGLDAEEVELVLAGCVHQYGEQGLNIGRNAWLQEGLPIETSATTLDLQCGSSQQAVNLGAAMIGRASTTSSSARASSTWATSRSRRAWTSPSATAIRSRVSCSTAMTSSARASAPR